MLAFKFLRSFTMLFTSFFIYWFFLAVFSSKWIFHCTKQYNAVPQSAINPTIQFVLFENSGKRVKLIFFTAFITFWRERKMLFCWFLWNFTLTNAKYFCMLRQLQTCIVQSAKEKVNLICVFACFWGCAKWSEIEFCSVKFFSSLESFVNYHESSILPKAFEFVTHLSAQLHWVYLNFTHKLYASFCSAMNFMGFWCLFNEMIRAINPIKSWNGNMCSFFLLRVLHKICIN